MQDLLRKKLWAVGGGKGGVGKSVFTALLASRLAGLGARVVLVDADLGGANLHILFGIRYPLYTLGDFITRQTENLEDVLLPTPVENLKLLCGADDILEIANPKFAQKIRLLGHLRRLPADIILLDLGAGTSFTTMDFFLYASGKIVVMTPQVTSIQNAYGFIKSCLQRKMARSFATDPEALALIHRAIGAESGEKMEFMAELKKSFHQLGAEKSAKLAACFKEMEAAIVVNMVRGKKEQDVGRIVQEVSRKYLDLPLELLGFVNYDALLDRSINNMVNFLKQGGGQSAGMEIYDIAAKVLKRSSPQRPADPAGAAPAPEESLQASYAAVRI